MTRSIKKQRRWHPEEGYDPPHNIQETESSGMDGHTIVCIQVELLKGCWTVKDYNYVKTPS